MSITIKESRDFRGAKVFSVVGPSGKVLGDYAWYDVAVARKKKLESMKSGN